MTGQTFQFQWCGKAITAKVRRVYQHPNYGAIAVLSTKNPRRIVASRLNGKAVKEASYNQERAKAINGEFDRPMFRETKKRVRVSLRERMDLEA